MIEDQLVRSRAVIGLVPKAPIEVRRVPEFKEATAPGAYYNPPALDGTRPGIFYANLRDMNEVPKFGMRTLAYARGRARPSLPDRIGAGAGGRADLPHACVPFTAYTEGWALYAEWLGTELGSTRTIRFGDLGRLQAEMLRAVRLVVDTGIHYKRWTREQAIAYMREKTGMAESDGGDARSSATSSSPGRPAPTRVGMMRIGAARERARAGARATLRR